LGTETGRGKVNSTQKAEALRQSGSRTEPVILISTSEIVLKSPYVRRSLQRTLLEHLRWRLRRSGFQAFKTAVDTGRIVVSGLNDIGAAETCSRVFGVANAMSAIKLASDSATLTKAVTEYAKARILKGNSFAVRAHVVGYYPSSSKEIEKEAGAAILSSLGRDNVKVDLDDPDKTIYVEVRGKTAYLYDDRISGVGGLPYGSQGRLVGLLSGGIDSPVALWLMMKRGSHVIPLFIDMAPYTGKDYEQRAIEAARELREYAPINKCHMIIAPFSKTLSAISSVKESRYRCVLCKRMMYRIACAVADRQKALGVVTGESLGQVASQTLVNLSVIDEAAWLPIHRPLIGLDKMEIQALAMQVGTYDTSARRVHGCVFMPEKPATMARLEKIADIERDMGIDFLLQDALKNLRTIAL